MVTCPEREAVRHQTLANLAKTDWDADIVVVVDEGTGNDRIARIIATWHRALVLGLATGADLILALEDDLEFNRHLRTNLMSWSRLAGIDGARPFFGSLYDPGHYAIHRRPEERYHLMDANGCWGAQAFVMSAALVRFILHHWSEETAEPDIRMLRLASRLVPIYYHFPSLVDHVGVVSTWGGGPHRATGFAPEWAAGAHPSYLEAHADRTSGFPEYRGVMPSR